MLFDILVSDCWCVCISVSVYAADLLRSPKHSKYLSTIPKEQVLNTVFILVTVLGNLSLDSDVRLSCRTPQSRAHAYRGAGCV